MTSYSKQHKRKKIEEKKTSADSLEFLNSPSWKNSPWEGYKKNRRKAAEKSGDKRAAERVDGGVSREKIMPGEKSWKHPEKHRARTAAARIEAFVAGEKRP